MFRISDFHNISESVRERAAHIKMVVTDVDGVLTDGTITYLSDGTEAKSFNVQDGLGTKLLIKNGIIVAVITGRASSMVSRRCEELNIKEVHQGIANKKETLNQLLKKLNIEEQYVAYIGDDLNDREALQLAGLKVAPANAHPIIKKEVDYITWKRGGKGAFRELADLILMSRESLEINNLQTPN